MNAQSPGNSFFQPNSATSEFNATQFIVQRLLSRVRTITLVQVQAVTVAGQVGPPGFVDVQPLISMVDGQDNVYEHGTVYNLAYFRYQAGTNAVILDPQVPDVGLALICDRDISKLKAASKAAPVAPGSARKFDFCDGIYLGGILGLNGVPKQYIRFYEQGMTLADINGNEVILDNLGITLQSATGNVIINNLLIGGQILGSDGNTYTGDIKTAGEITAKSGTGGAVTLTGHKHKQGNDSHNDVEADTNAPTGGT